MGSITATCGQSPSVAVAPGSGRIKQGQPPRPKRLGAHKHENEYDGRDGEKHEAFQLEPRT